MTIYDIAKKAGVSITTVSRVLNGKEDVSKKTRQKVETVMLENNYMPSFIARSLVADVTKTIGVVVMDVRIPHYANTAYVAEQELSGAGYHVILCNTGNNAENVRNYVQDLVVKRVDGIMFVSSTFNMMQERPEILALLAETPVVIANGELPIPSACSVLVDDARGTELAVQHLFEGGHRDIVHVKSVDKESARIKQFGYRSAMEQRGIEGRAYLLDTDYGIKGGRDVVGRLLEDGRVFSAIICDEDLTAIGVLKQLADTGIQVPGDVAVVGYNNSEYAEIASPTLTSVDGKGNDCSKLSAQLLCGLIEKRNHFPPLYIQPELVVRESSRTKS
ncbi:MAG: LacI family transcriptional regulator [Oscillospiraceae bacterium]|nr:LacI family transcriptional regulator [Oscillospiraceae bacterium]